MAPLLRRGRIAAFAALFAAAAVAYPGPQDGALTNETVVRLVAAGTPEAEVIRIIRQAPGTAFDLDPEVVVELRAAGVSAAIVEAMLKAQPPAPVVRAPAAQPATGPLRLLFQHAPPGGTEEDWTAVGPVADADGRPVRLAFYLVCETPTHVPDAWDRRTPLSEALGRHQLLWIHDASRPARKKGRVARQALDLPDEAPLSLEVGAHAIRAGVALARGTEPWQRIGEFAGTLRVDEGKESKATFRVRTERVKSPARIGGASSRIRVELVSADPAPPPPPEASRPPAP